MYAVHYCPQSSAYDENVHKLRTGTAVVRSRPSRQLNFESGSALVFMIRIVTNVNNLMSRCI